MELRVSILVGLGFIPLPILLTFPVGGNPRLPVERRMADIFSHTARVTAISGASTDFFHVQ
jgi:hypothetical protein